MRRDEVKELHYIAPIANVPSILQRGILSHDGASRLGARSITDPEVQAIRADKSIHFSSGDVRRLHSYANLYFNARNPMMYRRQDLRNSICVLRVSHSVLDLDGVLVSDMNLARQAQVAFMPDGLDLVDSDMVFAEWWTHRLWHDTHRHRGIMCAEALVPDVVDPAYILGAYTSGPTSTATLRALVPQLRIIEHPFLYFR